MTNRHISKRVALAATGLLLCSITYGDAPAWWVDRGVTSSQPADDYAVANLGQLKHIATAAAEEMLDNLPQGIDAAIWELVNPWRNPSETTDDFAASNLGQLKHIAKPFYDQLILVGYASAYPWAGNGAPDDFALANIGQAKNVFAFDITYDSGSGIPDWWEVKWFGQPGGPGSGSGATPGDSNTSLLQAYREGRDPTGGTSSGALADSEVGLVVLLPF